VKIVHQGLAALLLSGASLAHAVPHYSVTAIAPSGSGGYGINNAGIAVGYSGALSGFIYDNGSYSTYNVPGNNSSRFYHITDSGLIVGYTSTGPSSNGLRYDSATGVATEYAAPAGYSSAQLLGANNAGAVVGSYYGSVSRGFVDSGSGVQLLAPLASGSTAFDINSSGTIVGSVMVNGVRSAAIVDTSGYTLVGSFAGNSGAYAINDSGWIGGFYNISTYNTGAFLQDAQGNMSLFTLPSREIYLQDINNLGAAVGRTWLPSSPDSFGYLFMDGQAVDLNTRLVGAADWNIVDATGINDSGQIVGTGCHFSTGLCQAVLLEVSPVPEPGTWAMLLAGLATLGAGRYRARRRGA
jgi:hypothetical protein